MASSRTEIKSSDISPAMVEERIDKILKALVDPSGFEFNILLLQLSNWPKAKRRQTFRGLFKTLLLSSGSFGWRILGPKLRERGIGYYSLHQDVVINNLFNKLVKKIMTMDVNDRFIPEKVFTIPYLSLKTLGIEPDVFKYLLDKKIIILGSSFHVKTGQSLPDHQAIRLFRYMKHNLPAVSKAYDEYGLDKEIMFNPEKLKLTLASTMVINIETIILLIIGDKTEVNIKDSSILKSFYAILADITNSLVGINARYIGMNQVDYANIRKLLSEERGTPDMLEDIYSISCNKIDDKIKDIQSKILSITNKDFKTLAVDYDGELFDAFGAKFSKE